MLAAQRERVDNKLNLDLNRTRERLLGIPSELFGCLLLAIVFLKISGVRIWAHAYAGQPPISGWLTYYFDFFVSVVCIFAIATCLQRCIVEVKKAWPLWLFVAIALVRAFVDSAQPLGSFLVVSGYLDTVIALTIAIRFLGSVALHRFLVKIIIVLLVVNASAIVFPSISTMLPPLAGYFRGFMPHRNELAQFAVIAVCVLLTAREALPTWWLLGALGVAVLLIGLAGSVQGFILLPFVACILWALRNRRILRHPMFIVAVLFGVVISGAAYVSVGGVDGALAIFGRDSSFSGRDRIWNLAIYLMQRMPWYGYGFGNFGTDALSSGLLFSFGLGTQFGTVHNSYLEAILNFGWVGGSVFMVIVLWGLAKVAKAAYGRSASDLHLAVMLMAICFVGGFTESSKLFLPTLGWFTFVWAVMISIQRPAGASERCAPHSSDSLLITSARVKV